MTLPDPVVPGASVHITRRTRDSIAHFRPDPEVGQTFLYALAFYSLRHNLAVYCFCALSTHYHGNFHDPFGNHPLFRQDFNSVMTLSVNTYRGVHGSKWDDLRQKPVLLADIEALLESIAYCIANACRHHLVNNPEEWPGAISLIDQLAGPPQLIKKPANFHDPSGSMPDEIELRFVKPPMLAHWSDERYRAEIRRRVERIVREARQERKAKGRRVLGRIAILEQDPTQSVAKPKKPGERRPMVSCSNPDQRRTLKQWISEFRVRYNKARITYEEGDHEVEFPIHTFLLWRRYGVNCGGFDPPHLMVA